LAVPLGGEGLSSGWECLLNERDRSRAIELGSDSPSL
jgi:hypothetical protein